MDNLSDFLSKYRRYLDDETLLGEVFPRACERVLGFRPSVHFKVSGSTIFCEGSNLEKTQIILKKDKIIELINSGTGRFFSNIR